MKRMLVVFLIFFELPCFTKAQPFDPSLAGKLQNIIDSIRLASGVKGISACVLYPGTGTWKGVSGFSHAGKPITPGMEFGIASNTKLFTGVLLLKLMENNLIHLDDSLHQYLPAFKNIDSNITIRQLLNHTSGLYDVTFVPGYADSMLADPNRIFTAEELIGWAGPPIFTAGTGWDYCNTNYLLAGLIAERVTGQPFGKLLRDSILNPLSLDSTFLDVYDSILYPVAHPWQGGVNNISIPRKSVNSAAWAAGAMYSTSGEMAQWYESLMSGRVLNANSLKEMTTFVGSGNYGIGIGEVIIGGRSVWTHGGAIWGGYNSSMMYDVAEGIVICVLINQFPAQAFQVSRLLLTAIMNSTVSINENYDDRPVFRVYPNPANDFVFVDIQDSHLRHVRIMLPSGELMAESTTTQVLISNLPVGFYFISITTDQGTFVNKLVKK